MSKLKFKEISVEVRRVINIGNYETVTYGCTASAEVMEGEFLSDSDRHETYNELLTFCKEKVGAELDRLKGNK